MKKETNSAIWIAFIILGVVTFTGMGNDFFMGALEEVPRDIPCTTDVECKDLCLDPTFGIGNTSITEELEQAYCDDDQCRVSEYCIETGKITGRLDELFKKYPLAWITTNPFTFFLILAGLIGVFIFYKN